MMDGPAIVWGRLNGYPRTAAKIAESLGWPLESVYECLVWLEARHFAGLRPITGASRQRGWVSMPVTDWSAA